MVRRVRCCHGCSLQFVSSQSNKLARSCYCDNCCNHINPSPQKKEALVVVPSAAPGGNEDLTTSGGSVAVGVMESVLVLGHSNENNENNNQQQQQQQQQQQKLAATLDSDQGQLAAEARTGDSVMAPPTPEELPSVRPPVFDFYDPVDDEDDDDDDQRLMDLAWSRDHGSAVADAVASPGTELDKQDESSNSEVYMEANDQVIELLSSEDEDEDEIINDDDEGENEPILPDFDPEDEEDPATVDHMHSMALDPSDFQKQQDKLHAQQRVSLSSSAAHSSSSSSSNGEVVVELPPPPHPDACFICGGTLPQDRKRRLDHIKRCSKKHGVTARDIRYNDDHELFAEIPDDYVPVATAAQTTTDRQTGSVKSRNPYLRRKNDWHGDSIQDLAAGGCVHSTSSSSSLAAPTTTTTCTIQNDNKAAPSIHQLLLAGARRAAKTQQILKQRKKQQQLMQQSNKRPRSGLDGKTVAGFKKRHYSSCPNYKKIPGTDYCVDGFHYADPNLTRNYFLTHFHSDHYGGITKQWNAGVIYCSVSTANLVHQQLGVDRQYIHPLPMLTPTVLQSKGKPVTVTLLNANHCPGAVMILFEIGNRVVLHVGDFRWNYGIVAQQAPLRPYCRIPWQSNDSNTHTNSTTSSSTTTIKRIDDLYLDTTYCDAKYALPSQAECISDVVRVAVEEVRQAQASQQRLLMLFGAYTIGKEMVYLAVAQRLGMKVYVDQRRFRILNALDCWTDQQRALLTTRPDETILWVVPLGHVNMKKLTSYQKIRMRGLQRDFDRVVGFRPTGWALGSPQNKGGGTKGNNEDSVVRTIHRGNHLAVHSVPYSEHSSFPELVECIEVLNPRRIVPTVSVSSCQQQIDLLLKAWRDRQAERLLS